MDTLKQACDVLLKAEGELKLLMAHAAEQGEYEAVVVLADWARTLNGLRAVPTETMQHGVEESAAPGANESGIAPTPQHCRTVGGSARRDRIAGPYPKFVRDGENLVKIAWSKSSKSVYEHKAPKGVVIALAAAVRKLGVSNRLFSIEAVSPLRDVDGADIPQYQCYVALAWFRQSGFVIQHGRQGYRIQGGVDIVAKALAIWEKLPQRRNA